MVCEPRTKSEFAQNVFCILVIAGVFVWVFASAFMRARRQSVWPAHYITVVCPFSAGGGTDLLCRAFSNRMTKSLGVPVTVRNVTGGGGALGHLDGARSAPDGYTLTMATFEILTLPLQGFAPVAMDDFDFLALLNADYACIAVKSDSPVKSLSEFVEEGRKGRVFSVGNSGNGAVWHLAQELFASKAGVKFTPVPFDGASNAITAMLGGHVDAVCVSAAEVKPHADSGRARILAVMSPSRLKSFPDVPTAAECGIAGADFYTWRALALPKGVDGRISAKLKASIAEAAASAELADFASNLGIDVSYRDGADFAGELASTRMIVENLMRNLKIIK